MPRLPLPPCLLCRPAYPLSTSPESLHLCCGVACPGPSQLPPVSLGRFGAGFAFQSPEWRQAAIATMELREVVRQAGDSTFIDLLNSVRLGICTPAHTSQLAACHLRVKPLPQDGILPTRLYCKNADVDSENARFLNLLPGDATIFRAADNFKSNYNESTKEKIGKLVESKAPKQLCLKPQAQVMLTRNRPEMNLVNGSRGVVVDFTEAFCEGGYGVPKGNFLCPVVKFDDGKTHIIKLASVFQGGSDGRSTRSWSAYPRKMPSPSSQCRPCPYLQKLFSSFLFPLFFFPIVLV